MKSKLNDAELIAEAYAKVEVQEEALGALAAGIGNAARATGKALTSEPAKKIYKGAGKVVKKGAETVGGAALGAASGAAGGVAKAVSGVAQGAIEGTVGAVQGAVDGATGGIGKAAQGAGENIAGAMASDEEHKKPDADGDGVPDWADKKPGKDDHAKDEENEFPAADHDAPKGGIGSRSMDREELKAKIAQAKAKGHIGSDDAAQIMRDHDSDEDAEHDAPVEVDMSQNPAPESLEVSKEVEEPETSVAIVAPSIQPSVEEEPRVNHHDDSEVKMALAELYKIEKYAFALGLMMKETKALEGWTAAKITKAADYLGSVFHKLDYDFHADATDHSDIAPEDHEGH